VTEPIPRTGDWRLVAPAYSWEPSGTPAPRATVPIIQKYESSDFVTGFLADPTDSLPFDECDYVYRTESSPSPLSHGRRSKLADWKLTRTSTRKLFLPTHKRFYLVVCELHCERAGFPNADRSEVCEAGFVVRRRRVVFAESAERDATRLVRRVARSSADLAEIAARSGAAAQASFGGGVSLAEPAVGLVEPPAEVMVAAEQAQTARQDLLAWAEKIGAVSVVEGWFGSERDKIGHWQSVKERPGKIGEAFFPLYPLIPDPTIAGHPAQGRTIRYGVIPASSADHDQNGTARFDDRSLYEIRCFVRKHDPACPKRLEPGDCNGPVTWSPPTQVYQLAAQQDLVGTSNHPITIQMPDIPALLAQAAAMPRAQVAPVKFVTPAGSSLHFDPNGSVPTSGKLGGASICSFSIPLITIVATFVLNIFLPIVTFIFGLFALLRLKFCIPPSFQLNADLTVALNAQAGGADIDADVGITGQISSFFDATLGPGAGQQAIAGFSNASLVDLVAELATPPVSPAAPGGGGGGGGSGGLPGASGSACAALDGDTP
jgi:hypothetical protein